MENFARKKNQKRHKNKYEPVIEMDYADPHPDLTHCIKIEEPQREVKGNGSKCKQDYGVIFEMNDGTLIEAQLINKDTLVKDELQQSDGFLTDIKKEEAEIIHLNECPEDNRIEKKPGLGEVNLTPGSDIDYSKPNIDGRILISTEEWTPSEQWKSSFKSDRLWSDGFKIAQGNPTELNEYQQLEVERTTGSEGAHWTTNTDDAIEMSETNEDLSACMITTPIVIEPIQMEYLETEQRGSIKNEPAG